MKNLYDKTNLKNIAVLATTMARRFEVAEMQAMDKLNEANSIHQFNLAVSNLQELNRIVFKNEFDYSPLPVSDYAAAKQAEFVKEDMD